MRGGAYVSVGGFNFSFHFGRSACVCVAVFAGTVVAEVFAGAEALGADAVAEEAYRRNRCERLDSVEIEIRGQSWH